MFVADLSDRQEPDLGRLLASEPAPPGRLPDISIAPIEISELKFGESSTKERP
jgi:hypothetical protein